MCYSDSSNNRASTSTDALASLAWTGVVPTLSTPPAKAERPDERRETSRHGSQSGMNSSQPKQSPELKRGWTFAMAMTDEEVTDEVLVEQLEQMRNGTSSQGSATNHQFHPSLAWMQHAPRPEDAARTRSISSPNMHDGSMQPYMLGKAHSSEVEDATTWPTARRALLCCREMVRTEKRYQEELKALINCEVCIFPATSDNDDTNSIGTDNNAATSPNAIIPPGPPPCISDPP